MQITRILFRFSASAMLFWMPAFAGMTVILTLKFQTETLPDAGPAFGGARMTSTVRFYSHV